MADELKNQPYLKTVSVGRYQLKNVKREVEVFALDHEGLVKPKPDSLKGKTEEKKSPDLPKLKEFPAKSIAVLPFVNMSNDPEQEYFSEGVGEEILNSLASLKDLKVASRSSSFQFNGKNIDLQKVGEKLGVSTVLEGSVRKQGKRLRVSVQLVNVEDGFHLWSEKYDRPTDDIFAIQDEVALAVTEKLKVILLEKDRAILTKKHTQNPESYELYLKGRFNLNRRGAFIGTAIHYFQLAIDLDPSFALAHAGFADANLMAAFYGFVPSKQVIYKAKQSAETAIRLDPSLCEPYCSLGCFYVCFEWNWAEAEKNFLKSLELNHKYAQAHYWYGHLYLSWAKGDFFGAEMHGRLAVEQEPQSAICHGMHGSILHTAGKYKEALAACKKGIEIDESSFVCRLFEGWSYLSLRKYEEAMQCFEKLLNVSKRHHFVQNAVIITYCIMWKFREARTLLDELKERSDKEYVACMVTALSSAYLDDMDKAFEYFEKAYEDRDPMMLSLKNARWVPDSLKEDPRYQKILDKVGFPTS
jgi:TolB-like protein/Tfp pilus assembly protein PilF